MARDLQGWPASWRARMQRPRSGEYVTFMGKPVPVLGPQPPARLMTSMQPRQLSPDPIAGLVDDLLRRYDPGGYTLACPVAGCGWELDVPRMELDPEPLEAGAGDWVAHVEAVPREDVEAILRTHVHLHAALTETDVRDAPLPLEPDHGCHHRADADECVRCGTWPA